MLHIGEALSDLVYSTDPETGESEYKEVLRTFRKESDVLIHIFVNGEEIQTTPVHPFWVEDQWVAAKDLEAGDILTLADGSTAPVTYTYGEQLDEPVIVYNFEVSDFHTYYVTDTGVLVHNDELCVNSTSDNVKNASKNNSRGEKDVYRRPSGYRKGVRDKVWDRAVADSPDGIVIDPVTKKPMNKNDPWDMGHKPGYEFRKHRASAQERGISRKDFLNEHNDPSHYRPELPSSNRSHKGEDISDVYKGP